MEQIRPIALFEQAAALLLPGFLYNFNLADFKRRNSHLGHVVGDADIAEFDGLIAEIARVDGTARRIGGDRWLMLSRANANARIEAMIETYRRADPFICGWRITADRGGERRVAESPVATTIRRSVRCLYTEVADRAALAPAIAALEANNWSLPVDRLHLLSAVFAQPRERWICVDQYPEQNPACPFCGGQKFDWYDGDMDVYSGDGFCKGCRAEVSIHNIR
jgi:GGDEF domain-containing protein